ncbi:hypothetical protein ACOMHN_014250 [Nucella lapillus]
MYFLAVKGFRESAIIREMIHDVRQKKKRESTRADVSSASGGVLLSHILDNICWLREDACDECLTAQPCIAEPISQLAIWADLYFDRKLRWCLHQLEFYAASLVIQSGGTMDRFHDMLESLIRSSLNNIRVIHILQLENVFINYRELGRAHCSYTPVLKTEEKYEAKD